MANAATGRWPGFGHELRDFFRFLVRPDFRRLPARAARDSWHADWFPEMWFGRCKSLPSAAVPRYSIAALLPMLH